MSDTESYVTNDAWVRQLGRPDLIDEVADQFERPAPVAPFDLHVTQAVAVVEAERRWPRAPRGWRSQDLFARHGLERRVG